MMHIVVQSNNQTHLSRSRVFTLYSEETGINSRFYVDLSQKGSYHRVRNVPGMQSPVGVLTKTVAYISDYQLRMTLTLWGFLAVSGDIFDFITWWRKLLLLSSR